MLVAAGVEFEGVGFAFVGMLAAPPAAPDAGVGAGELTGVTGDGSVADELGDPLPPHAVSAQTMETIANLCMGVLTD